VIMAPMKKRSKLFSLARTELNQYFRRYAGVVRGANAYIPPGARRPGFVDDAPKSDIPKVSINGPDGTTLTHQVSTSNGATPIPSIVSATLLRPNSDAQLECSPLVMPSSLLSVNSSAARNKDSPRRSKLSLGLNGTSGLRTSSSSVKHSRSVPDHVLFVPELIEPPITAKEAYP
jgi:hypothetical protein